MVDAVDWSFAHGVPTRASLFHTNDDVTEDRSVRARSARAAPHRARACRAMRVSVRAGSRIDTNHRCVEGPLAGRVRWTACCSSTMLLLLITATHLPMSEPPRWPSG